MKCALCKEREANKKNTHYLSDGIIRKSLNLKGKNVRETGYYFNVSSEIPFIEFNFQRIDEDDLKRALGREPYYEELEKARQIPFSVDYVFCNVCEKIFTKYETDFSTRILPRLRDSNLSEIESWHSDEIVLIRMFFYIQIWRNSICEKSFALNSGIQEQLRLVILNEQDIKNFPITITYLETLGGDEEFTRNFVGSTNDINPYIVFMNDFVIQFYDNEELIKFDRFYGLNNLNDFNRFININETEFIVKIIHNEQRIELFSEIYADGKAKTTIDFLLTALNNLWFKLFLVMPPIWIKADYLKRFSDSNDNTLLKYSKQQIFEIIRAFIIEHKTKQQVLLAIISKPY